MSRGNGEDVTSEDEVMVLDIRPMKIRVLIAIDFEMKDMLKDDISNHITGALELLNVKAKAKILSAKGRVEPEALRVVPKKTKAEKGGTSASKDEDESDGPVVSGS